MRHEDKNKRLQLHESVDSQAEERREEGHVVFDFTGLQQANVGDLALILTARLGTAPTDTVWVRSLPWRTAEVLRILKLDHLFQAYPEDEGLPN
ncbi:MAG: hypothetical protein R3253_03090 [Longimicrobiales bacterium]|nr:hypothetical protein [Longimicrobiales bacterium]